MLLSVLEQYGLSQKEAEVYLKALELGQIPVSTLSRQLNMNRVTVYSILKKLEQQGVMHSLEKKSTTFYSAVDPEVLFRKLEEKYKQFQDALPEFAALGTKYDNKPKMKVYDGAEGLKTLIDVILSSDSLMQPSEEFLTFTGTQEIDEEFMSWLMGPYQKKRASVQRSSKCIITGSDNMYNQYTQDRYEYLMIDDESFTFSNEIVMYNTNKVAVLMYSSQEMGGVLIESKTLHDALVSIFNLLRKAHT